MVLVLRAHFIRKGVHVSHRPARLATTMQMTFFCAEILPRERTGISANKDLEATS
jgi:hypothetical protein